MGAPTLRVAASFDEVLKRDMLVEHIIKRVVATLTALSIISILLYQLSPITYLATASALCFLIILAIHRINRRRRVFTVAKVLSVKEIKTPITFRTSIAGEGRVAMRLYHLSASDRNRVFNFIDSVQRNVGDSIILLLDGKGRVLAVSKQRSGENIETLERLR